MDRRCLFILISTIFYNFNNIQCYDIKHHPIDFLKSTNDENLKHEVITSTSKTNGEDVIGKTTPKTNGEEPTGIQKFIGDVKNKFNHIHPVRDVKEILFGPSDKKATTIVTTSNPSTTETVKKEKSHIEKIADSMPSESEDMIRVITLKEDEHYGKGKAKPKYLTKELQKINSTEYVEGSTSTAKTVVTGKSSVEDFSTSASTTQKSYRKSEGDSILK